MKLKVNGEELDFDLSKMLNVEVIAITKTTGISFDDFAAQLQVMNFELITAIVWTLKKRTQPDLRYSDVQFPIGAFELVADEPGPKDDPTLENEPTSSTSPSSPPTSGSIPGTSTG